MRILLLNPPGKKKYLRDHYCSTTTKANYYWQPIDLVIQSAIISQSFKTKVIDANANNYGIQYTLKLIKSFKPDYILSLASIISLEEDLDFFKLIKSELGCKIMVSGDIFKFEADRMIKNKYVDAILMNYTSKYTLNFFNNDYKDLKDIIYKDAKGNIIVCDVNNERTFSYPIPNYDTFASNVYRMPFMRYSPIVSVTTSFGCPFLCGFCPLSNIKYKERDFDSLFKEFDYLFYHGIKEIIFRDPTFSANMNRTKYILKEMIKRNYNFSWVCDNRIDTSDEELLYLMKKAGCHTILYGIESGSDIILKNISKNINTKKIKKIFDICNRLDIQILAHFIIGLPEDNQKTVKQTIDLVLNLEYDFLALNLYAPRYGSKFRSTITDVIKNNKHSFDSTDIETSFCKVSIEDLKKYKRKAILKFYFNPKRIFRILRHIKTFTQLKETIKNSISLIKG